MISLVDDCSGWGRRDFLRIGALSLGGVSLSHLLAARAAATSADAGLVKDKSVIFLLMQGGPSQFETFDPKMTAPSGIRSVTGEVQSTLPGVTFASSFPKLASLAKQLAIVRSFVPGNARHDIKPLLGSDSPRASLGAMYSRVAGQIRPGRNLPSSAVLYPRSIHPDALEPNTKFGNHADPGLLGAAYAPFVPGTGSMQSDMRLNLSQQRLDGRRLLLRQLDALHRSVDSDGMLAGLNKFQEQAFTMILGGVADAFDLRQEDPRVIARYDTAPLVHPDQINQKWNNHKRYVDHSRHLGKLMLLARRLCEAGCGFVTVTTDFVWDHHADSNNAGVEEGMRYCGLPFDHAVATFLEDIHERGLDDKILLVCCGEIGRTPRVNARGGRDHWGNLGPLMLAGGGLPMGKVIGQSTRDGGEPATEPVTITNLWSTIMHTVFDLGQLRLQRNLPADLLRVLTEGQPIAGLA